MFRLSWLPALQIPTGKKEKQNAAGNQNMEEWRQVQGILDKIKSTGMGGIRADHPHAVEQLEQKLKGWSSPNRR